MIRGLLAGLVFAAGLAPAMAAGPGGTPEVKIRVRPVEITGGKLKGLDLLSAVALRASSKNFGGFSGLKIEGTLLTAVSDTGWWLLAEMHDGPAGLLPARAGLTRMLDEKGRRYLRKRHRDAEGLTTLRGNFVVSLERDHRLAFHLSGGRIGRFVRDRRFRRMRANKGLEALATTPDGSLLAIGEEAGTDGHPMYLVRGSGKVLAAWLPAAGDFSVTGADVGPDGRLYVLLRHYSTLSGVSVRIHRYRLGADGFPLTRSREVLAAFETASGIDNMEGIALWKDSRGRARLTLISDDNFSLLQRTLLIDFRVK